MVKRLLTPKRRAAAPWASSAEPLSLGFGIMHSLAGQLAGQLGGSLGFSNGRGAAIRLTFPTQA